MKSVFISYAHKDGLDFTRRLAYSLSIYVDVFWDRNLQATEFPAQLESEIEKRDILLLVMTPVSIASEWCKHELRHAETHKKDVVLAKIFNAEGATSADWTSKYTFGDFTEDFDVGFRRVTKMMLGQSFSSWEYLSDGNHDVIESFRRGMLPGIISKNIIEWLIVDKLWTYVDTVSEIFEREKQLKGAYVPIRRGQPRTPRGVLISINEVLKRFSELGYRTHIEVFGSMTSTVGNAMEMIGTISDQDNKAAGNNAFNLFTQVRGDMVNNKAKLLDPHQARYASEYLEFDLAEKLCELINLYSRRSRYLY